VSDLMNGVLVIDKPENYTSRDIVNLVSKRFHTKKVGHTGTLDPLATGVLVLCLGDYTKFVSLFTNHQKEYIATIRFGIETDTLDISGTVLKSNSKRPSKEIFQEMLKQFLGPQIQEVPKFSAKKVHGKKLYEYARNQEEVELPKQEIQIYELELLSFSEQEAVIRAVVSKGTYIRSLIRDLCQAMGLLGTMSSLRRTRQGDFSLEQAISLDELNYENLSLLDFTSFLKFDTYQCTTLEKNVIDHRNELVLPSNASYVLISYEEKAIALYQAWKGKYKPLFVFDKDHSF